MSRVFKLGFLHRLKQKQRWASSVPSFANSSFSDSDTLSFPNSHCLICMVVSEGILRSCFIYLTCNKETVMASTLSEIVEEEIGSSLRSKLSRTSESSLASVASLSMPLIQEIVLSADIRCSDCQERVADIMSRMIETYSILVSVLEKKVTLTCTYSGDRRVVSKSYCESLLCKISSIKRIICPSSKKQQL